MTKVMTMILILYTRAALLRPKSVVGLFKNEYAPSVNQDAGCFVADNKIRRSLPSSQQPATRSYT
jgi:hypothetical protein